MELHHFTLCPELEGPRLRVLSLRDKSYRSSGTTLLKLPRTSDSNQHSWEPLAKYCLGCQVLKYDSLPNPEFSCYFMSSNHTISAVLIAKGLLFQTKGEEGTKQALSAQGRWAEESINHQCCKVRRMAASGVIPSL